MPRANGSGASATSPAKTGDYPTEILDLIVFHKLHLSLAADRALKSYHALKERFVDWNEIRISSVREIQEALSLCPGSLELAVFIKSILELVHRERQDVSLEFLSEKNLGEIRQYLKQLRGIDRSTVELILRMRKEHAVFPLSQAVETVLLRLGVLRPSATRSHSQKALHDMVDPARALVLHHFLLDHSRAVCPPDESAVDCPRCSMRQLCAFYARSSNKHRKRSSRVRRAVRSARSARNDGRRSRRRGAHRRLPAKAARHLPLRIGKSPPLKTTTRRGTKGLLKRATSGKRIRRVSR